MAKRRSPQEIREEAKKIMTEARKKQVALIQEAKELENKKYIELGLKCKDFLNKSCTEVELKEAAIELGIVTKESVDDAQKDDELVEDV